MKTEKRNCNQGIALDLPVNPAKVRDTGTEPVRRSALSKVGINVTGKQVAAARSQKD